MVMKIHISTKNQKKIELVKDIFTEKFPNEQIEVYNSNESSEVPDTPWDKQTYQGAKNRVKNAIKNNPGYDFYTGLETGLTTRYDELFEEAWCFISKNGIDGVLGYGSGYLIDKNTKTNVQLDTKTNTKILEVYDINQEKYVMYSGSTFIREISLRNAITSALSNLEK